jgi:rhodanese-related sulfurtransferase
MTDIKTIAAPEKATVDTPGLAVLVRSGLPMVILDARGSQSADERRIPGAKALGINSTANEVASLIGSKDTLIVTYCTNLECPMSENLAKHLKNLGYQNILVYKEGIEGWVAAGYPVEQCQC